MKKYNNFKEVVDSWKDRSGNALLYDKDGQKTYMTYAELYEEVTAYAEKLHHATDPCDALAADHSPETVIRIFADVIAGRDLLLADAEHTPELLWDITEKIDESEKPEGEGRIFFFTSGTTSRSRVVILTSRSLTCSAFSGQSMLACGEDDVILSVLPLSHVFGFVCSMLWGLAYGSCIALGRGIRSLMEDCLYFDPTILPCVPTIIEALHRFRLLNQSLKVVLIGAAPCTQELTEELQSEGLQVYLGYGLTETSSGVAITQDQKDPYALVPCPGADIRIEQDGEVSIATPCMMEGYLGEESPLVNGRFYTGDLGSLDGRGRLHLSGRKKDIIVLTDGTKVFCPEYEAELSQATGVKELAVAQRGNRPVLVVSGDVNRYYIQDAVDHFNRVRARSRQIADIVYISRPLPRTSVGKIRRWELQQLIK